jgi:hypothetical protein
MAPLTKPFLPQYNHFSWSDPQANLKLRQNDYNDLYFTFWYEGGILNKNEVRNAVKKSGIIMPSENWSFFEEAWTNETDNKKAILNKLKTMVDKNKNRICINIRYQPAQNGDYSRFFAKQIFCSYIVPLIKDIKKGRNKSVVCAFFVPIRPRDRKLSISGKKTGELIKLLNRSLEENLKAWKTFAESEYGKYGYCDPNSLKKVLLRGII